jgi:hypothetical protein
VVPAKTPQLGVISSAHQGLVYELSSRPRGGFGVARRYRAAGHTLPRYQSKASGKKR